MDIELFRSSFHGQVLEPANAGYNEARQIWNASVSQRSEDNRAMLWRR